MSRDFIRSALSAAALVAVSGLSGCDDAAEDLSTTSAVVDAVSKPSEVGGGNETTGSGKAAVSDILVPETPDVALDYPNGLIDGKVATILASREEAARFLIMAGFGGDDAEIDALVGTDAAEWVAAEIAKDPTLSLDTMLTRYPTAQDTNGDHAQVIWENMMRGDDVLRQRMFYALSQIFVINQREFGDRGYQSAYYTDLLRENAFGNYRELLGDVTYSPAMGRYLTYIRNRKANPRTGAEPDENYAREVLQLFSIGLLPLNMDGTVRAGVGDTYTNDDIVGLSRFFTGLWNKTVDGDHRVLSDDWEYSPMEVIARFHSEKEKSFLGTTIPAGTPGPESIEIALDRIASHPTVAPFISRQLIQRFTAASPSPAYVRRVAVAFSTGAFLAPNGRAFGSGRAGDLEAAIAAVLLDLTVHDEVHDPNEGKPREPVLKFLQHIRTFDVAPDSGPIRMVVTDRTDRLSQNPLRSPSVFNFYRPGYISPVSATGDAGLTAPELQIVNEGTALGFYNFMTDFVFDRIGGSEGLQAFVPDFDEEAALADDPEALVDNLDVKMTGGLMSAEERAEIIRTVSLIPIDPERADMDRLDRARVAVFMTLGTGAYGAQD